MGVKLRFLLKDRHKLGASIVFLVFFVAIFRVLCVLMRPRVGSGTARRFIFLYFVMVAGAVALRDPISLGLVSVKFICFY